MKSTKISDRAPTKPQKKEGKKGNREKLPIQASFQYKSVESIFIIIFKFYGTRWQETNESKTEALTR